VAFEPGGGRRASHSLNTPTIPSFFAC
jgi:hypothetical protein